MRLLKELKVVLSPDGQSRKPDSTISWASPPTLPRRASKKRTTKRRFAATPTKTQVCGVFLCGAPQSEPRSSRCRAGDPEAHAKFQELSKAYSVLSDDAARARYDELGESGVSEQAEPQFDAMLFFRQDPLIVLTKM